MADLMATGTQWLSDQLTEHASKTVVYQRGAETVLVSATVGSTLMKLTDDYGNVYMERTDRDYLIPSAALILDGVPVRPQRGDVIREPVGSETWVYEVMAPGGEPEWRWSDPHRVILRIHTKRVEIVS